jgi:aminopeptidase
MYEDLASKLARVVTEYSAPVQPGNLVMIQGSHVAVPLLQALNEAVLRRGGHPYVVGGVPGLSDLFFELADEHQLTYVNPIVRKAYETADVIFSIFASTNTKGTSTVDPERLAQSQKAGRPVFETFMTRLGKGELQWCGLPWPTQADAQEAEMGLLAYTKFIYEACAFHLDDPIAHWEGVRDKQTRLVDYLSDKEEAVVKGPGIDMRFNFKERVWISCHGEKNFPDGEIFTGPIEDSVNGTVEFNLRTVYGGREVSGVRLEYKDGKIIDASATKNEEFLLSQLDIDEGARRMGEFAIGTNWDIQRVTGSTLFDEKIGGTIHMAVGFSIPDSKGTNVSSVHWDMVHDMKDGGEITIDGKPFYRAGKFLI